MAFHRLVTILPPPFEQWVQGRVDVHQLQQVPAGGGRDDDQIALVLGRVREWKCERACQEMEVGKKWGGRCGSTICKAALTSSVGSSVVLLKVAVFNQPESPP